MSAATIGVGLPDRQAYERGEIPAAARATQFPQCFFGDMSATAFEVVEKLQSFAKVLAEVDRLASSPTPRWLSLLDDAGLTKPKD